MKVDFEKAYLINECVVVSQVELENDETFFIFLFLIIWEVKLKTIISKIFILEAPPFGGALKSIHQ